MIGKALEIRDRGTFIPVVAVRLQAKGEGDGYLLRRAGLGEPGSHGIALVNLQSGEGHIDPHHWGNQTRTMPVAHEHIDAHWDELVGGDVVDVEFILGQSAAPKPSERNG
jgi:hypothetical protein